MKKIFSFFAAILFAGSMMAATTTYQHIFTTKPSTGTITLSDVSWTLAATNLGSYNSANYAGVQVGTSKNAGSFTLTSSAEWGSESFPAATKGKTKITQVRLWLNTGGSSVTPSVTIGDKAATSDDATVVKNSAAESYLDATKVTFTPATGGEYGIVVINIETAKAGYVCAIEIDCEEGVAPAVATPTFTTAEEVFANSLNVKIACTTDGAAIYYTLDETEPSASSTLYTDAGIDISNTTTIKAIAIKGEEKSAVATKTYTKVEPVSLTDFLTTKPASEVILKDLTVIFADGQKTYVVDEGGVALVMYDASKTYYDGTLTAGKVLSGQKATYKEYKNQDQIVPTNAVVATDGVAPTPILMNAAPTEAQVNKYISFKNVAAALETDSKYYIFDGAIQLFGASTTLQLEAEGNYDLAGILINYNGTQLELIVTSLEKSTPTAIDNTEAGVKANKVLRDGVLLIEKNGVLYNAQGAVVR